jgi:hypothetical protein
MNYADRVKDTTATSGTGPITLAQAVQTGYQLFGTAFAAVSTVTYCISSRTTADWEIGNGVFTPPSTLSRSPTSSSNAGALVVFGAETKDVFVTQSASTISRQPITQDIAFATAIPLTQIGTSYMPQQSIASVLAFTPAANPVKGALVYLRLLPDGVNIPTFVGFKEWGGSLGYLNTNRVLNEIQFFFDGSDSWFSISQAVGATAEPITATAITMTGPDSGIVSTASSVFTIASNGTLVGSHTVTPSDAGGGGAFTPTSVTISSGSPSLTFTYTPNATVATRTISAVDAAGLTAPANITYNVTASATVPATMGAPGATAGDTTAALTWTLPSNGGAALTSITVTPFIGATAQAASTFGAAAVSGSVTGLTNTTAYTFKVHANNSVGAGVDSAASNSVTPVTAAGPRFASLASVAESGTGPYTYTGGGGSAFSAASAMGVTHLQSGVDGRMDYKVINEVTGNYPEFIFGLTASATAVIYQSLAYGLYVGGSSSNYQIVTGGAIGGATVATAHAVNDIVRLERSGTVINIRVSKDAGATYTTIHSFAGAPTTVLNYEMLFKDTYAVQPVSSLGLA